MNMIYLIGGAPRVGKSTAARSLAKEVGVGVVSTDELEELVMARLSKEQRARSFPLPLFSGTPSKNTLPPEERVELLFVSARSLEQEIDRLVDDAIRGDRSLVIEGVSLLPRQVDSLIAQYGQGIVHAVFVVSDDVALILEGMAKNTNPDDWAKELDEAVRRQVAEFTAACSKRIANDATPHKLPCFERTADFANDVRKVVSSLRSSDTAAL
jgi:2-phosphoglycerate kinase